MFNAEAFMNTTFEEANATRQEPCPEGEWTAAIERVEAREVTTKAGEKRVVMDVHYNITDPEPLMQTGRDKILVRQSIFLDMDDSGRLDFGKGKNTKLGRLREAVGQNVNGQPWAPSFLVGQPLKVVVSHRAAEDGEIYDDVKKVLPLQ